GDACIRFGEGRGIVDAVSHHEDCVPLPPQGCHILRLVRRKHPGPEVIYPQLGRNGGGGAGAVPGEHDSLFHAQSPQSGEHIFCLLPQGVGDTDHGGEHSVDCQVELGELR
ncbi:DUF1904 domain-containing protein, partial [Dysosmobacter welbionis]